MEFATVFICVESLLDIPGSLKAGREAFSIKNMLILKFRFRLNALQSFKI